MGRRRIMIDEYELEKCLSTPEELAAFFEGKPYKRFFNDISDKEIVSGVYKISVDLSHKFYIGSSRDIKSRWDNHIRTLIQGCHSSSHLQRFYNKHKELSISIEVLEICHPSDLKKREQWYLDTLQPFGENGFNAMRQSYNYVRKSLNVIFDKDVYFYSKTGENGIGKGVSDASFQTKVKSFGVYRVLNGAEKQYKGYIFSFSPLSKEEVDLIFFDKRKLRHKRDDFFRKVRSIDENGNENIYDNVRAASSLFSSPSSASSIRKACRTQTPYKGFKWSYILPMNKDLFPKHNPAKRNQGVCCYSVTGEHVKTYNSLSEAAQSHSISTHALRNNCYLASKTCCGKIFLFKSQYGERNLSKKEVEFIFSQKKYVGYSSEGEQITQPLTIKDLPKFKYNYQGIAKATHYGTEYKNLFWTVE